MENSNAQKANFVRQQMLGEQAPPVKERGVSKWMRDNLFSSYLSSFLTLISVFLLVWLVASILPWLINSVWQASSLSECREILVQSGLGASDGACFAVITNRWHQLIFGFYPPELYWRPVLALIVFLLGLAPILFHAFPRTLLGLSFLAPFICFWLLWGGSIWLPVAILSGFFLGYGALKFFEKPFGSLIATILAFILPAIYWLFGVETVSAYLQAVAPLSLQEVESRAFGGFMLSAVIGLSAIVLSLPLGILLALARQSNLPIIKWFAVIFIEIARGVPMIVWLFTAQLLLAYFLPPGTNFDLTLRVIIMVTLLTGADLAEVIRGGLAGLSKGQYEGANSLGLSYWQSMRLIILPQALRISIPNIVNSFIGLFKDTTLVVFIGLLDPLGFVGAIRATAEWNGVYWELFIFIGALFFIACYVMARYAQYLEKRLARGHH